MFFNNHLFLSVQSLSIKQVNFFTSYLKRYLILIFFSSYRCFIFEVFISISLQNMSDVRFRILKIKTGVVKRLLKDISTYETEAIQQEEKIKKLKEEGKHLI